MSEEIKLEVVEKTQKTLGKHVSKPPLTEKLLRKPPFRFLHDIITTVIRDTGFLKGLFSETELISDNVKERDAKIAFLTKFIEAIKAITEVDLKVKPTKIVAGLEPAETNKLLQTLAMALDKKLDSTDYVKKLKSKSKTTDKVKEKKSSKTSLKDEKVKDSTRTKKRDSETMKHEKPKKKDISPRTNKTNAEEKVKKKIKKDSETKVTDTDKVSPKIKKDEFVESPPVKNTTKGDTIEGKEEAENKAVETSMKEEKPEETDTAVNGEQTIQQEVEIVEDVKKKIRSDRPKSARPQSGDYKKQILNKTNKVDDKEISMEKPVVPPVRPMSSLRPPSVRPSSARPGAPRLRSDSALPVHEVVPLGKINVIVENYNTKEVDEEETVVIQNADVESEPLQQILDIPEEKGHLVEQILEQIHDDDVMEHVKIKNEIDWENEGFRNRDATNREINQLRSQIQSLTKVANPLGKLMNYLHEDIESMLSELNMWMNMKREMYAEINKQKKINEESSRPLKQQLHELEENIRKQEIEIANVRSNILRNDIRIKDLLVK